MENKTISTHTYQVQVPVRFAEYLGKYEYFSVWNVTENYVAQFPIMNMALSEITDLDESFVGKDYSEKVYNYFATKRINITESEKEQIEIAGKKAYVQRSVSKHQRGSHQITVFSLFVNIPLDNETMLEFSADCEVEVRDTYESLFLQTIQSVELLGDYAKHLKIYNDEMDASIARIEKITASLEADYPGGKEPSLPAIPAFEIPADGQDVFQVGNFQMQTDTENSKWQISLFNNMLMVTVEGTTEQSAKGMEENLLDDSPGDGKVSISFEAKGIYHPEGPVGVFRIEDDKCVAPYLYLRTEGFNYSLKFFGNVTFAKNWVGFNGYLKPSYGSTPCFPVLIYKQLNSENLDWTKYQFQSMQETAQIAADQIKFLMIDELSTEKLPEKLFTFENLEKLIIQDKKVQKLPLNEISPKIGQLKKLQSIRINHASLEALPEAIGQLNNLTELSIHHCSLTEIPTSVWQLPRLENLSFTQNQLTTIPAEVTLPNLKYLSLDNNQLTSLPAAITALPKLRNLDLEDNPWEKLPASVLNIGGLKLAYHQKKQLFDFSYRGADGTGLVEWDDRIYHAEYDDELLPQLESIIENNGLQQYAEGLKFWVKKAIGFTQEKEEDYHRLGNHRFGGMPDLPPEISYPRYGEKNFAYEFIAQINCSEIADLQGYLPRKGMLYFFLSTIHDVYDGNDTATAKVLYYPEVSENLISGKDIKLETTDYFEMFESEYKGYQATAKKINSCPAFYPIMQNLYIFRGPAAALHTEEDFLQGDAYDLFEEPLIELNPATHAVNGYGFSQHEYPELSVAQTHRGNPEDWIILLEVNSAGDMQWGDAGSLFYVIHKSDLTRGDFSKVYCTMYSS